MDRSADNIGQVINDIQRDLEELKTTQIRGEVSQAAMTANALAKEWTIAPYHTGYKSSNNAVAPQAIMCCVWNGIFFLKFGVSPNSGNFPNSEVLIGEIPTMVDGVDLTKMFPLNDGGHMRGFATGSGSEFGFFGLAYNAGEDYVRLVLRVFSTVASWMEGSIALKVTE